MTQKLTYGSYLRVAELLSLQHRVSEPAHHDEMLFIVVHQVHELWFKQIIHELEAAREALDADRPLRAIKVLKRIHAIQRVLISQIDVLETMTPAEFNAFRSVLRPASGFQSAQFREIEFLSGGGDDKTLSAMTEDPALLKVERRRAERSVWDAFLGHLHRTGAELPAGFDGTGQTPRPPRDPEPALVEVLRRIYERAARDTSAGYEQYLLAESLIDYDENFLHWRARHVRMVERTIGMKQGTGGSEGAKYLNRTLERKFFPELWEVRTVLGA